MHQRLRSKSRSFLFLAFSSFFILVMGTLTTTLQLTKSNFDVRRQAQVEDFSTIGVNFDQDQQTQTLNFEVQPQSTSVFINQKANLTAIHNKATRLLWFSLLMIGILIGLFMINLYSHVQKKVAHHRTR